jgi:hypothetical protein
VKIDDSAKKAIYADFEKAVPFEYVQSSAYALSFVAKKNHVAHPIARFVSFNFDTVMSKIG